MASTKSFTPRGVAVRPRIDRPYKWDQSANKVVADPEGDFSVQLALSPSDAEKVKKVVKEAAAEAGIKKLKNEPFTMETDRETGDETGRVIFTFKQNGTNKRTGKPNKIYQVDGRGKPLPSDFKLTAGSEIIVAYHPFAYPTLGGGVKLYLDAVQVIKYVERDGVSFAVVEDAFEYEGESEVTDSSTDDSNGMGSADF